MPTASTSSSHRSSSSASPRRQRRGREETRAADADAAFRRRTTAALETVRALLRDRDPSGVGCREPVLAGDTEHSYHDKYALTEFLTNAALAAQTNVLEVLGLRGEELSVLREMWSRHGHSVTLRLAVKETCGFVEERRTAESPPAPHHQQQQQLSTYQEQQQQHQPPSSQPEGPSPTGRSGRGASGRSSAPPSSSATSASSSSTSTIEYHWRFGLQYILFAYAGDDAEDSEKMVVLQNRSAVHKMVTTRRDPPPRPSATFPEPMEVPLDWLLDKIRFDDGRPATDDHGGGGVSVVSSEFRIDRSRSRTPRRNRDVQEALRFTSRLREWASKVRTYFVDRTASVSTSSTTSLPLASLHADDVFVPVLPLLDDRPRRGGGGGGGVDVSVTVNASVDALSSTDVTSLAASSLRTTALLPLADVNRFLREQIRSLDARMEACEVSFPHKRGKDIVSAAEAKLVVLMAHVMDLADAYEESVDYVERMLRTQLGEAVGKDLTPADFEEFFRSHTKRIFRSEYQPTPFCYSVRRPNHFPEGTISIEPDHGGSASTAPEPVLTMTRKMKPRRNDKNDDDNDDRVVTFRVNASTRATLRGDHYLHAWVLHDVHKGAPQQPPTSPYYSYPDVSTTTTTMMTDRYRLVARANRFSGYLLMVGRVGHEDGRPDETTFDPRHALLVENDDEVVLPLVLDDPRHHGSSSSSPSYYRDVADSLSPEQRAFVAAFRAARSSPSSVFAICVVPLRPQLETLLGLPRGSLTKEVRLTRTLLDLLAHHRVPSDLLACRCEGDDDREHDSDRETRVERVRNNAKAVADMLAEEPQHEIQISGNGHGGRNSGDGPLECSTALSPPSFGSPTGAYANGDHARTGETDSASTPPPSSAPTSGVKKLKKKFGRALYGAKNKNSANRGADDGKPVTHLRVDTETITEPSTHVATDHVDAHSPRSAAGGDRAAVDDDDDDDEGDRSSSVERRRRVVEDLVAVAKRLEDRLSPTSPSTSWTADGAVSLRRTPLRVGRAWERAGRAVAGRRAVGHAHQRAGTRRALDLLDRLSRSGSSPLVDAELHAIVAATHRFVGDDDDDDNDRRRSVDLAETLVRDNRDPVRGVERSAVVVASTLFGRERDPSSLLESGDAERVAKHSPFLFGRSPTAEGSGGGGGDGRLDGERIMEDNVTINEAEI